MSVTFAPHCFDPTDPVDPDWEEVEDPSEMTGHKATGWEAEPRFRVETGTVELAADALVVAADRFMRVTTSGRELSGTDETWTSEEDRTPSITRVSADDAAAYISADTSEWLSHEMADTMKAVLVEELTRAGVTAVISPDYDPIRGIGAASWPAHGD
ncbi:hypothetical protein AAII07_04760 [Microvirga sp. 0TCS3.31]